MKKHLLKRWDFFGLLFSLCGVVLGVFWMLYWRRINHYSQDWMGVDLNLVVPAFEFGFLAVCGGFLFFCVVFCRRYFSAEARCRRIVDREERLEAERRRRREEDVR